MIWPAEDSLLATLVRPAQRSSVFSLHHATLNAGFGVGGVASALVVDVSSPFSFELLYFLDALSFLAFVPILLSGSRRKSVVLRRRGEVAARVWRAGR